MPDLRSKYKTTVIVHWFLKGLLNQFYITKIEDNLQTIENLEVIFKGFLQRCMVSRAVFKIIRPDLMTRTSYKTPGYLRVKKLIKNGAINIG